MIILRREPEYDHAPKCNSYRISFVKFDKCAKSLLRYAE